MDRAGESAGKVVGVRLPPLPVPRAAGGADAAGVERGASNGAGESWTADAKDMGESSAVAAKETKESSADAAGVSADSGTSSGWAAAAVGESRGGGRAKAGVAAPTLAPKPPNPPNLKTAGTLLQTNVAAAATVPAASATPAGNTAPGTASLPYGASRALRALRSPRTGGICTPWPRANQSKKQGKGDGNRSNLESRKFVWTHATAVLGLVSILYTRPRA